MRGFPSRSVEASTPTRRVRFGVFEVNLATGELRKSGNAIKLQEQPFKLLELLLERPGELITREELRSRIWPDDSFGDFDHATNVAVGKLRTALGDSADHPSFIETIPRRGYRFVAKLEAAQDEKTRPATGLLIAAGALLLGLVGGLAFLWTRPSPIPTVTKYVQLTHDGAPKELLGTDGTRLYLHSMNFASSQEIEEMSVGGGERRKLSYLPANMFPLSLSADSSKILLVEGQVAPTPGPLWSVPLLGGSPHRLAEAMGQDGAWSPDGTMLAYANGSDLMLARADGTEPRKLASVAQDEIVQSPVWSPDGTELVFANPRGNGSHSALWEVSIHGKGPHALLAGWHEPPGESYGSWTADKNYFLFHAQDQIWALPAKDGRINPAAQPVQITSSPMPLTPAIPSKDGKQLFVVGATTVGALMRFDSKRSRFAPFLGGLSAEHLDFSKDGQWVAYVSYPEGTLWRSRVDGSDKLQLTYPPSHALLPRWSPDGKTILFTDVPANNQHSRMYLIPAAGGTARPLQASDTRPEGDGNWSPDGSKIAFGGNYLERTTSIRILDRRTSQVSTLPESQGLFLPRWSPDGRYLAAIAYDTSTVSLFDFQSGRWTQLVSGGGGWLNWSHDGRYVYLLQGTTAGTVIRVRVTDRKVETIADLKNFTGAGYYGGWMGLTPDDSPLLLRDMGTYDVYALDWKTP